MALKGTLEAFTFSTLEISTVDDRRLTRKELADRSIALHNLDVSVVGDLIFPFFVRDVEMVLLDHLMDLLAQFNELASMLVLAAQNHPSWYESINIKRLISTINEIRPALAVNKEAFTQLMAKQANLPIRMQVLFQELREHNTRETKIRVGQGVFALLCEMAGAKDSINAQAKINEAHVTHSKELAERFAQGYIYHWSLEEEIKHIPFNQIFTKFPEDEKELYYQLTKLLDELTKTTNAIYSMNWKHVALIRRVYCLFSELAFKEA
ncbi:hypothetical protein HY639_04920 [Candidatus Woesearchaeota archaeon]|nr:hypothetical protein [Candidatus Woesearchaeota archaeon]